MRHVMVDLETTNVKADTAIVAIGAVVFDETEIQEEFYANVNLDSCIDRGMTISHETLCWWTRQPREARELAFSFDAEHIMNALSQLSLFVTGNYQYEKEDIVVWGNGAAFDNAVLNLAYSKEGLEVPWDFRNDMCYRTVRKLSGVEKEHEGVYHYALDDAKAQAFHLMEINKQCPELNIFNEGMYKYER